MSQFNSFIFKDYVFDVENKILSLNYSFDDLLLFTEKYHFNFNYAPEIHKDLLEIALQTLFYMAGVSYFKAYLPKNIVPSPHAPLDEAAALFFSKTYQKGLGEFFYVNNLDPLTSINFLGAIPEAQRAQDHSHHGKLIGVGGGKDSLVSIEILSGHSDISSWSVGHRPQLAPLVSKTGLEHFWVERTLDRTLLDHNTKGALNGHIPISAIYACVGFVVAALTGKQDIVVSNESSASEPSLTYRGVPINHQYSKSLEFEIDFQNYLENRVGDSVRYFSFLRPLSELRISEIFAKLGFDKYKSVFSSCNRAFTQHSEQMFWCGECPKCAFIFLALTPFVNKADLEGLWNGKNLLLAPGLEETYRQLLGVAGDKPLDCVGEIKESRAAMKLAQEIYPQLKKYQFYLPEDYDFRSLSKYSMPEDMASLLFSELT